MSDPSLASNRAVRQQPVSPNKAAPQQAPQSQAANKIPNAAPKQAEPKGGGVQQSLIPDFQKMKISSPLNNVDQKDKEEIDMDLSESKTNLIINYLPPTMNEGELASLFSPYGAMEKIKIVVDLQTGRSRGYGFVKFKTEDYASRALQAMNGYTVQDKKLKVAYARPQCKQIQNANLFVSNIPLAWDRNKLRELFTPGFGEIIECRILKDEDGQSRGVGFVRMDTHMNAMKALQARDKYVFDKSKPGLIVKLAQRKNRRYNSNNFGNNAMRGGMANRRGGNIGGGAAFIGARGGRGGGNMGRGGGNRYGGFGGNNNNRQYKPVNQGVVPNELPIGIAPNRRGGNQNQYYRQKVPSNNPNMQGGNQFQQGGRGGYRGGRGRGGMPQQGAQSIGYYPIGYGSFGGPAQQDYYPPAQPAQNLQTAVQQGLVHPNSGSTF